MGKDGPHYLLGVKLHNYNGKKKIVVYTLWNKMKRNAKKEQAVTYNIQLNNDSDPWGVISAIEGEPQLMLNDSAPCGYSRDYMGEKESTTNLPVIPTG